jgi:hypothetical protein
VDIITGLDGRGRFISAVFLAVPLVILTSLATASANVNAGREH